MANTLSSSLILDTIAAKVMTVLGNRWAPLNAFSQDFTTDGVAQNAYVQVRKYTDGTAAQTNPSTWETGDTTATNVAVQVKQYSVSATLTSMELNQHFKLENAVEIKAELLAKKVMSVALAPVTAANFATAITGATATTFAASGYLANVQAAWAGVAKSLKKSLILDATAYSRLLPSDRNSFVPSGTGAFGFDNIYLNTLWTGAATNVYGIACGPEVIACASGIPMIDPTVQSMMAGSRNVTLDGLGLTVQINTWASVATRAPWFSLDVMFGAALGDNTNAVHFITA